MAKFLAHHRALLAADLTSSDYDGKTMAEAYEWLFSPRIETKTVSTRLVLTPMTVARLLGISKGEAIAKAFKVSYPLTADYLMEEGIDPDNPEAKIFLDSMVSTGVLDANDLAKIEAAKTRTVDEPLRPRVMERLGGVCFIPESKREALTNSKRDLSKIVFMPNDVVAAFTSGIPGFPNLIPITEFEVVWNEVRG